MGTSVMSWRQALGISLLAALAGGELPGRAAGELRSSPARVTPAEEGLELRLADAAEQPPPLATVGPTPAERLTAQEAQEVLDRLPPLPPEPMPEPEALREASLPPPRTGAVVRTPFPPPGRQEAPPAGGGEPLALLRASPEGEVGLAAQLSLTFSQPMVPLGSHEELARVDPPVRLQPQPAGRWRWVGTRTLVFDAEPRLPMATEFQVEVPAGTRSATGGVLQRGRAWRFGTPAPTLTGSYPSDMPVRRDALLLASFDQRIDPAAVLPTVRVEAAGREHALRLARTEEVEGDAVVRERARQAGEGRWLAFRTVRPLPPDAAVRVSVGPGTPSAEGPRRTAREQAWSFRTYGPLRIEEQRCGWDHRCPPGAPWRVRFSNPIDPEAFQDGMVRVSPELPARVVEVSGHWVVVRGRGRGSTSYTVSFAAELPDAFGQTLGAVGRTAFTTTPAEPVLTATGGRFVVLDPAAASRFSVWSVNHARLRVRGWSVRPRDWPAFHAFAAARSRNEAGAQPPGRLVLDTLVEVRGTADELAETRLDLGPALPAGHGHLVLLVTPKTEERPGRQEVLAWVQATAIGLWAAADGEELLAWASALADGAPIPGVQLELMPSGARAVTGEGGLARLPLPAVEGGDQVLLARHGAEEAMLPAYGDWWLGQTSWRRREQDGGLRWFVFDDRQMYRPGEQVRVKGWLRRVGAGKGGDVEPAAGAAREVAYRLRDSRGNELAKGSAAVNEFGAFDLSLALPATVNLGRAALALVPDGRPAAAHEHSFQVQEFRRPEYEVAASASEAPHLVGTSAVLTVSARYFAGGGLGDAPVRWTVAASEGMYRPPHREEYSFGRWTPWWEVHRRWPLRTPSRVRTWEGRTDATGVHRLQVGFEAARPPVAHNVRAEASVTDVNRQAWTAGADLLVHPAEVYVGLRTERPFVERGARYAVHAIVTDLDGRAVAGRSVRVVAERLVWRRGSQGWSEEAVPAGECALVSAAEAVACGLRAEEGGVHRISATAVDAAGRPSLSELQVWAAGGRLPERRAVEQERVSLVPARREFRAGETAEVLLMAPFAPAEGLLTLRRSGIVRSERFRIEEPTHTLRVPIEEGFVPNVHLQVDLVGAAARSDDGGPPRPAFASGGVELSVPPHSRTLSLEVAPREAALPPGGGTTLDLALRDAQGRPVPGGEVALVVVDEAVLSLTGYRVPDPIAAFYAPRQAGATDHHLRSHVLLAALEDLPQPEVARRMAQGLAAEMEMKVPASPPAPAPAAGRAREDSAPQPLRVRRDFAPLALFAASVRTGADGRAQVPLTVPDSLTRFRVMAVAATRGREFGSGESVLTVRLPLMARPSPPRFLNFGDRFELPVVVQNQTEREMSVDVAVRAQGLEVTDGAGRRVSVPAAGRVEVRFPMAARRPGPARVQVGAVAGEWSDAAEASLPVWTPATTEAFAVYGQVDEGVVVQPVRPPSAVLPSYGGLELTTSSTALQALTDAVLYLAAYPFECSEQLSSRVLAVAALRDVLAAFRAPGLPEPGELEQAVVRDLERLARVQNGDGGFPFWRRGDASWPYVSIHVAHALQRAREKGFTVPAGMLEQAHGYLKSISRHIRPDHPPAVRRTLEAYALHVRGRLGDHDPARARALLREGGLEGLSFEALGWLLPVLARDGSSGAETAAIRRHLLNRVAETAGAAHFAVSYGEAGPHLLLHSHRRADAVLLEALVATDPRSDLVAKLVQGLLGHRTAGRWGNTQENVFVLLAMDRYFHAYERVRPDFVARAWLGDRFAGESAFRGRGTERHQVEVPMAVLLEQGPSELTLAKEGAGRLYYRLGLRYAPRSLRLDPADHGFTVSRVYEPVDRPEDVRRDADGTWRIRAGARVRVHLTLVAPGRRHHVALVDPLPAGLEALNPALATTGRLPERPPDEVAVAGAPGLGSPHGHWWRWRGPWYEHQNMRDERVEAFSSLLFEGVYSYAYFARATTPGRFIVAPARAEEMYHPETFGRSGTDRLHVE